MTTKRTTEQIREHIEQVLIGSGLPIDWVDMNLREYRNAVLREYWDEKTGLKDRSAFGHGGSDELNAEGVKTCRDNRNPNTCSISLFTENGCKTCYFNISI